MQRVTRIVRLHNVSYRRGRKAANGKPAVKERKGHRGIFDCAKSWLYASLILRDPADPYIPGTKVRRLETFCLGARSQVAADAEIERVISELRAWHKEQDGQAAAKAKAAEAKDRQAKARAKGKTKDKAASPAIS
jgi:hypothetical protein